MKKHLEARSSARDSTTDHKKIPKGNEVTKSGRNDSISKITERVLKEHRPALDWLAGR